MCIYFPRSINYSSYLGDLSNINKDLDESAVRVDCWGVRTLVSKDPADEVIPTYLDTVAYKIINTPACSDELDTRKEIVQKLKNFYSTSNSPAEKSSLCTFLFGWTRRSNSWFYSYGSTQRTIESEQTSLLPKIACSSAAIRLKMREERWNSNTGRLAIFVSNLGAKIGSFFNG